MSKNIIFFADGTWNGPGEKDSNGHPIKSNVQKLYESLPDSHILNDSENECEIKTIKNDTEVQVAKYLYGLGAGTNPLFKLWQGAFGEGLVGRLVRGYTYISRNYADGDQIILVGFSRGAYTVRALAGLILAKGLLDWREMNLSQGSDQAYAFGIKAWLDYRKQITSSDDNNHIKKIADAYSNLKAYVADTFNESTALKFVPDIPIHAIGVWDTVGALGIPKYSATKEQSIDAFQFANTTLSTKVKNGFHAISIDEQRVNFTPTLWDCRAGVVQTLFPGAHADIGGGYSTEYDESGLSDGALKWMSNKLSSVGMMIGELSAINPKPTSVAHQPWVEPPYDNLPQALRHIPPNLGLSQSVVDRVNASTVVLQKSANAPYRPGNLVNTYFKPDWSGVLSSVTIEP